MLHGEYAADGFIHPFFGDFPPPDGAHDGAHRQIRVRGNQEEVGAGTHRENRHGIPPEAAGERTHLQPISHDQPPEPELVSEEIADHRRGEGGGEAEGVERGNRDMPDHDGLNPRIHGCAECGELHGIQTRARKDEDGEVEM